MPEMGFSHVRYHEWSEVNIKALIPKIHWADPRACPVQKVTAGPDFELRLKPGTRLYQNITLNPNCTCLIGTIVLKTLPIVGEPT